MNDEQKHQEERQHYMMAWFCSVLLFFLLGGWYLSSAQNVLHIANGMWAILLFLYVIINASYHCYYQILPYMGERRLLVFADLAFIVICTLLQFPVFVILVLINTQIALMLLSLRLESPLPKKMFVGYLLLLIFLCMLLSESSPYKMISFIVLFCGESIFILSLWYGFEFLLKKHYKLWQNKLKEIKENRIQDHFLLQKELRSLQKTSNTETKNYKQLQKSLKLSRKFLTLLQDDNQQRIFKTLSQKQNSFINILSLENKELATTNTKQVRIDDFLHQVHNELSDEKQSIKIQYDDSAPEDMTIPLEPLGSWIFYQWLLFFSHEEEILVIISQVDDSLSFKGVAKANIKDSSTNEDTCPKCDKKVRSLYKIYNKDVACSQCCRKILESRIRGDESAALDIVKKILSHYKIGATQCGISSWDYHEYFFTIQLKNVVHHE
ncbi:hypothetical protein [Candidatus Uabimicrobium sp. HlEnr_7]|uniref:hypothetical protein n=1 Tax=Candidatus Uabimicrobium helgolandensis TaxID=3095367 RepID=UPI003555D467